MIVRFTEAAEKEYVEALCWYGARAKSAAEALDHEVDRAIGAIAAFPNMYPRCDERHHIYRLKRFPFQIVYRLLQDESCLVVALAHTARLPNYWKNI